jgi:hypothetical protein
MLRQTKESIESPSRHAQIYAKWLLWGSGAKGKPKKGLFGPFNTVFMHPPNHTKNW